MSRSNKQTRLDLVCQDDMDCPAPNPTFMPEETTDTVERNLGAQPLDALMTEHSLDNHDIVAACEEPLTHKAVQRGRKGRRLTTHMQRRITAAMNKTMKVQGKALESEWKVSDLFTY